MVKSKIVSFASSFFRGYETDWEIFNIVQERTFQVIVLWYNEHAVGDLMVPI